MTGALLGLLLACVPNAEVPDDTPLDTDTGEPTPQDEDDARVRALTGLPEGDVACAVPVLARVDYAVDGDTFYATPEDGGARLDVRIIGVDTPEIEHDDPAECYGDEAFAWTSGQLEGNLVWLTFDAECVDIYGRTLAYVFRDDTEAGFFDRALARNGYATELTIEPNDTFSADIREDVRAARDEGRGMWSACSR